MMSLFDLIANAQNGKGVDLIARQFNLNQQQAQLALEALLPAFSEGLKRNSGDPMGFGGLMQAMMAGNHARYFEDAASAFSAGGIQDGNSVLGQLFGSKELSRAVAANAQAMTGIGADILKQMLPVIASMLMGGLARQTAGAMQAPAGMGAANPFGQMFEQMMRQGMGGGGAAPENPFGRMLEQMMGGGAGQQAGGAPAGGTGNPWIDMMTEMMKGAQAGMQPRPETPQPQARRRPAEPADSAGGAQARNPSGGASARNPSGGASARNPMEDMLGQMFETGRSVQKDYEAGVKSIFDQYVKNMDRLR